MFSKKVLSLLFVLGFGVGSCFGMDSGEKSIVLHDSNHTLEDTIKEMIEKEPVVIKDIVDEICGKDIEKIRKHFKAMIENIVKQGIIGLLSYDQDALVIKLQDQVDVSINELKLTMVKKAKEVFLKEMLSMVERGLDLEDLGNDFDLFIEELIETRLFILIVAIPDIINYEIVDVLNKEGIKDASIKLSYSGLYNLSKNSYVIL